MERRPPVACKQASGIEGGQTVRLAYDVLGPVPVGPVQVSTSVVRPGRRVELLEAVLSAGDDRPLMRLSAWRLRSREDAAFFTTEVAYHRALDWRFAAGTFNGPGPATAWTRPECALVAGETMTPLQHLLVMTDAASGVSATLDWTRATFANVDLSVALHRLPRGEWLGVDAATVHGGQGAAQCFAVLFDADGPIGRSSQSLFVEPR